jgi:hypothetical protein
MSPPDPADVIMDAQSGGYRPGSPRQRFVSMLLSGGIIVLVVLFAIYQTQVLPRLEEKRSNPMTFNIDESDDEAGAKAPEPQRQEERRERSKPVPQPVQVEVPEEPDDAPVPARKPAFTFMRMSREDMAAADIGGMKSSSTEQVVGGGGTYGPGEGPGGAILYNADWFRKPTDAQLSGYLPAGGPREGWGMIACQTIERYRVENCQILAESPRGSGFGRAVLDAAWQFQVVPPRINGKPKLGEWVRIRIDYGTRNGSD